MRYPSVSGWARCWQRGAQPGADLGRPRALVVQVEGEGQQTDLAEPVAYDVERGALLGDEEDPPALGHLVGEDRGDGLRLAGARRSLEDEGLTRRGRPRWPRPATRRSAPAPSPPPRPGRRRRETPARPRGEAVGRRERQMAHQRPLEEPLPVGIEVAPEEVPGERDDREPAPRSRPGTAGPEAAIASRTRRTTSPTSTCSVARQRRQLLRQARHGEPELQPQLLHEAVVQRDRAGLVDAIRNGMTTPLTCRPARAAAAR